MNGSRVRASLVLRDGAEFAGFMFGASRPSAGEAVFNTGMVGYPEALTDPSYYGQILILTYPLIGNYGVPSAEVDANGIPRHFEADRIMIRGLVTANYDDHTDHWNASRSLGDWLDSEGVPGLHGIDTRALTRHLRERGTMLAKIVVEGQPEPQWYDPSTEDVVSLVSRSEPATFGDGSPHIVVVDCGMKYNILRCLVERGARVTVVPSDYDFTSLDYDGLFLTNGPGDPEQSSPVIERLATALQDRRPIFGICLGCQLLALAAGARTFKLPYGHRAQNQPVVDVDTGVCSITSQNHGYVVDANSLPEGWEVWFTNGNDGTLEGLRQSQGPHRAVQFHPEAACGPTDTEFLFDKFLEDVRRTMSKAVRT